ncbi:hypothetical protein [Microlunatus antarcticus]|uniref:Uncharacterized protein n=1 Tax=Microlunatus antarcticus TaxID=53388 RepID=A0A7W5JUH1_9ACTN|nr:hypothetical protein [Microlunatus antarcticus]MBB3326562.1 hypothetical protein [Microlunatus antarcticus]
MIAQLINDARGGLGVAVAPSRLKRKPSPSTGALGRQPEGARMTTPLNVGLVRAGPTTDQTKAR